MSTDRTGFMDEHLERQRIEDIRFLLARGCQPEEIGRRLDIGPKALEKALTKARRSK